MMPDLIKQSLSIIGEGFKSATSAYTDNLQSIKNDADTIRANLSQTGKTAAETLSKMKNGSSPLKRISDWFFQKSDEYDDFDLSDGDSDFDAGFTMDDMDDENDSSVSISTLDTESMRDIARGQVSAMFQIGGKQAEVSMATSAEIVSSINNRSSEIVASIGQMTESVNAISGKLDQIIRIQTEQFNYMNGISGGKKSGLTRGNGYDPYGELTLANVFKAARESVMDELSIVRDGADLAKHFGPSDLMGMLIENTVFSKKIKAFGNQSIDDIGKKFNDFIGATTHSVLSELIDSSAFKNIFGDIIRTNAEKDYQKLTPNHYTTDRAVFDGMTRQSIIHIIPEYLKKINENLSGQRYEVDSRGHLTDDPNKAIAGKFATVTRSSFGSIGLSYDTMSLMTNDAKAADINTRQSDISIAAKALQMGYVMRLYKTGRTQLMPKQVSMDDMELIQQTVTTLVSATGKPSSFWEPICGTILLRLTTNTIDLVQFCQGVNRALKNMDSSATKAAKVDHSGRSGVGKLSYEMAANQFIESYSYVRESVEKTQQKSSDSTDITPTQQAIQQGRSTILDYVGGIFKKINEGINVRILGGIVPSEQTEEVVSDVTPVTTQQRTKKRRRRKRRSSGGGTHSSSDDDGDGDEQEGSSQEDIISDNRVDKALGVVSDIMSPHIDTLKNIMFGSKISEDNGVVQRTGGLVGSAKDKLIEVGAPVVASAADTIGDVADRAQYEKLKFDVKRMDVSNPDDKNDQIYAQQVFSLMQTSVTDGETEEDLAAINDAIGAIKNEALRSKLQKSVTAMLRRSGQKADKKNSGLLSMIVSGAKKVISPVMSTLKKFFGGLLSVGTKIGTLVGKIFKAFVATQKTGLSNIGRGLFGQKGIMNDDGTVQRPETEGLLRGLFKKPIGDVSKASKSLLSSIADVAKKAISGISDLISGAANKLSDGVDKITNNLENRDEKSEKSDSGPKQLVSAGEASGKFGFMEGLKDSLNEAKESARQALMSQPQTFGDKKLGELDEAISGKKSSVFTKLVDITEKIFSKIKVNDGPEAGSVISGGSSGGAGAIVDSAIGSTQGTQTTITNTTPPVGGKSTGVPATTGGAPAGSAAPKGGKLYSLGQTLGGLMSAAPMIGMIVQALSAVFPGFGELVENVKSILFDSLQPLNGLFKKLFDALKPVLELVGEIITVVADSLMTIVDSLLEVVQPILEAIQPILETIFGLLQPILDIIVGLVEIILAPLMGVIEHVIVPILRYAGNSLEILLGVVQVGLGIVISALGGLLIAVGSIVKFLSGNSSIVDQGKSMWDMGTTMVTSGIDSVKSGITKQIQFIKDVASGEMFKSEEEKEPEEKPKENKEEVKVGGSVMDGTMTSSTTNNMYGSGDTTIYNNYYNEYGSGNSNNQHSYGHYMNMSERGCGPVALADVVRRRTGSSINPAQLAAGMSRSGAYNPNMGTSVGDFVDTGGALGMTMRVGGVTAKSLKQATPSNPITVIGSGSDYGTRKGNNHYMNVVGSDKAGGVYVSNPMSGRVERRPMSTVVMGSKLGIYGSGDAGGFSGTLSDALENLKTVAGKLFTVFTGKSTSDKMKDSINAEKDKEASYRAQTSLGDDFTKFEDAAFTEWGKSNPIRDGETDEEHRKRFQNSPNYHSYLNNATIIDDDGNTITMADAMSASTSGIESMTGTMYESAYGESGLGSSLYNAASSVSDPNATSSNAYTAATGWGAFASANGVMLEGVDYIPTIREPNVTSESHDSNTPLHEWFGKHANDQAYSTNKNWFRRRSNPDRYGEGRSGDNHKGVDINWNNDSLGRTPLYPTTSGVVTSSYYSSSGGNMVQWKDSSGTYHTYMHMKSASPFKVGDTVVGGESLLGYVGTTGNSSGEHLHYQITEKQWPQGINDGKIYNPFTYFGYVPPSTPGGVSTGFTNDEKVYSYLVTSGMTPIGAAGLMGCFKYESDMRGNNLENVYADRWGVTDDEYTKMVDSGVESEDAFVHGRYATYMSHQKPGEAVGYGIGQQTASELKQDMYDRTVKQGLSIATLGPQLDGVIAVLKQRGVYDRINNAATPTEANQWFLWRYEAGTGYNSDQQVVNAYDWMGWEGVNNRHKYAEDTYKRFMGWTPSSQTSPTGKGSVSTGYGMVGSLSDAKLVDNVNSVGTTSGIGSGIVNTKYDGLNLRQSPTTSSSSLALIPKGTVLTVEACSTPGWLKTTYNGQTGYVSKDYIALTQSYLDDISFVEDSGYLGFEGANTMADIVPALKTESSLNALTGYYDYMPGNYSGIPDGSSEDSSTTQTTVKPVEDHSHSGGGSHRTDPVHEHSGGGRIRGSGDALYRSILGAGDFSSYDMDIPPIDMSDYAGAYSEYVDSDGRTPTIIQKYELRPDDSKQRERLNKILHNTYSVRAKRVEELLEEILKKMDDNDKKPKGGGSNNGGGTTPKMFDDDRIPSQVHKLSVG